jgi:hypothetical protein
MDSSCGDEDAENSDDTNSEISLPQFASQISFNRNADYYNRMNELYNEEDNERRERLFQFNLFDFLLNQLKKSRIFEKIRQSTTKRHNRQNSMRSSSGSPSSKHVIFADSLGMDLELIHTIQIINTQQNASLKDDSLIEFRKVTLTKQTFFNTFNGDFNNSADEEQENSLTTRLKNSVVYNQKTLIPQFVLSPDVNYEKLIKNGICLNSVDVFNQSSIRGIILTFTKSEAAGGSSSLSVTRAVSVAQVRRETMIKRRGSIPICSRFSRLLRFNSFNNDISANTAKTKLAVNPTSGVNAATTNKLDLVYVIWSTNDWKSWKYHAAIQKNCKATQQSTNSGGCVDGGIIKTHEFFIQNLDHVLDIDRTLQLIVCHQVDMVVFKDMHDASREVCYNFKCAYKI